MPLYLPFLVPQNHAFIRKKHLQISEKANFAEFCRILQTAKIPDLTFLPAYLRPDCPTNICIMGRAGITKIPLSVHSFFPLPLFCTEWLARPDQRPILNLHSSSTVCMEGSDFQLVWARFTIVFFCYCTLVNIFCRFTLNQRESGRKPPPHPPLSGSHTPPFVIHRCPYPIPNLA